MILTSRIWNKLILLFKPNRQEYDVWKFITYDRVQIKSPSTELFRDSDLDDFKPVTSFTEDEIIEFIYKNKFESLLHEELGYSSSKAMTFKGVTKPFITNQNIKPGDLDLIILQKDNPEKTTAIEVKCIKAETLEDGETKFNKENNISKGITQVNEYLKFGFYPTYLLLIILDNGREMKNKNPFYRDSKLNDSRKLFNENVLSNLNTNAGIIYMKINQMTGKSINQNCKVSILKRQDAVRFEQSENTTKLASNL